AHREKKMEPSARQIDVDLVRNHRSRHLGIGDVEHVFVRRALKLDAAELAHRAARPVASRDPPGRDFASLAVRLLYPGDDSIRSLLEAHELRAPPHAHSPVLKSLPQQSL